MQNWNKKYTYPLFETIRYEKGRFHLLDLHANRMRKSAVAIFGNHHLHDLLNSLEVVLPNSITGKLKFRVEYSNTIGPIWYTPYKIRKIRRLELVESPKLVYNLKWKDRHGLSEDNLPEGVIPLFTRNGRIKDTSYTNVLFFDGEQWITPKYPLFYGVQRQFLLRTGQVKEKDIFVKDLNHFERARLITAMMTFEDEVDVIAF